MSGLFRGLIQKMVKVRLSETRFRNGDFVSPAGSRIRIGARAQGSDLVIEVADAGTGFPAEFLPHAFERFRRPDGGRARPDGGSGLGLAIVAAVAAAHGGYASARNSMDSGAIVTLDLPDTVQAG